MPPTNGLQFASDRVKLLRLGAVGRDVKGCPIITSGKKFGTVIFYRAGLWEHLKEMIYYLEIPLGAQIVYRWTIQKAELEANRGENWRGQGILSSKFHKRSAMVIPGKAL